MSNSSRKGSSNPKAKMGQLSKGKARSSKPFEASSQYLSSLSEMLINPAECPAIVRTPADFAVVGDVKCFTRTFQLKSADVGADGNFSMTLRPTLLNFFSVTTNAPYAVGPTGGRADCDGLSPVSSANSYYLSGTLQVWNVPIPTTPSTVSIESGSVYGRVGWYVNAPGGSIFQFSFSSVTKGAIIAHYYDTVTGTWNSWGVYNVQPAPLYTAFALPPAAVLGAVAFECRSDFTSVTFDAVLPINTTCPSDVNLFNLYSSDAVLLGQVERFRVTAMSILASYSGNMLNNGGVIAAARTQPGYSTNDIPYTALTRLQDHKYQGPIVEGAYAWWLPYSYEEMDYRTDPLLNSEATQLRVAGQFADPSGALTITLTVVVEFFSPLQIFSHESGPFSSDEYLELLHALDRIPAATCNPSHREILSGLWSKGVGIAREGVKYLSEHPELVAKIAAMFL